MNDFTASNGMQIEASPECLIIDRLGLARRTLLQPPEILALKEFFRSEEDERLGRWRWPENPDYVVYPGKHSMREAQVVNEVTGCWGQWSEREAYADAGRDKLAAAASAYFDAHPEPKPWHKAQPGEIWALKFGVSADEEIVQAKDSFFVSLAVSDRWFDTTGKNAPEITAGRRIYPEVTE